MISVEIQEWQQMKAKLAQLQQQVNYLRMQNSRLKKMVKTQQNEQDQFFSSQGNISIPSDVKQMYQMADVIDQSDDIFVNNQTKILYASFQRSQNLNQSLDEEIELETKKKQFKQQNISNKQNLYPYDVDQIRVSRKSKQSTQLQNLIKSQQIKETNGKNELHLIEQICLFGPTLIPQHLNHLSFKNDQKQLVQPSLYYPQNSSDYKEYGNYLFPNKVRIKPTQKVNIPIEGNKTIFKSSKKQQCQIFIFQGNQDLHPIKKSHQMLQNVNPSKWLYGIVIQFNDFVYQDISESKQSSQRNIQKTDRQSFSPLLNNKKMSSLLEINLNQLMEKQIQLQTVSLKDIELQNEKNRMFRSTFSLCIFTYFPFVHYLQGVISMIFDEIKLKRIQSFPITGQFKDCDIFYFVNELDKVAKRIKSYFLSRPVKIGKQLSFRVNEVQSHIDLSQQNLQKELYCNWAYKLMKMMDRDTCYYIYCLIMLEESVFFVCDNQRTLTFMILLFASMMTKPFIYPYPVVSVIFTQELLHTPFTSIIGINQPQSWLQQAYQKNLLDFENKNFVVIDEKEVKIKKRQKFNFPKSQNLRKIFTRFYKKTQPSSLTNIIYRKDPVTLNQNMKETNEYIIDFYAKLQLFYHENIFAYMPSNMRLPRQEEQSQDYNKVQAKNKFLSEIEKEYKRLNPNYWRDQFIKLFLKTQIFSIYMMNQYELQD